MEHIAEAFVVTPFGPMNPEVYRNLLKWLGDKNITLKEEN